MKNLKKFQVLIILLVLGAFGLIFYHYLVKEFENIIYLYVAFFGVGFSVAYELLLISVTKQEKKALLRYTYEQVLSTQAEQVESKSVVTGFDTSGAGETFGVEFFTDLQFFIVMLEEAVCFITVHRQI